MFIGHKHVIHRRLPPMRYTSIIVSNDPQSTRKSINKSSFAFNEKARVIRGLMSSTHSVRMEENWPRGFRGEVVQRCGRTTEDGRTTDDRRLR